MKGELGKKGQRGEPDNKGAKGNLGYPGYKGEKVWPVLKVHLAQLVHRVLMGCKEKLVREDTWAKKVNQVTKA